MSVLSPCVLPVIPIIVTGTEKDHFLRPVSIVSGLASTFILMGILSSVAGSFIAGKMLFIERGAGIVILIFGVLLVSVFWSHKNLVVIGFCLLFLALGIWRYQFVISKIPEDV